MLMCNSVAGQENTDQQQAAAAASFIPDRLVRSKKIPDRQIPSQGPALASCAAGLFKHLSG